MMLPRPQRPQRTWKPNGLDALFSSGGRCPQPERMWIQARLDLSPTALRIGKWRPGSRRRREPDSVLFRRRTLLGHIQDAGDTAPLGPCAKAIAPATASGIHTSA